MKEDKKNVNTKKSTLSKQGKLPRTKKPKAKKCRECGAIFSPINSLHIVCGMACSLALVKRNRQRENRAEKLALKKLTRSWWIEKTQTAVNKWVRERDSGLPCVSCGKPDGVGKRNAGHYRPAGVNSALRFDPRNIHGQCETCNTHKSGNLTAYRVELIRRIGIDAVVELDDNHNTKRWSIHELASICQAVKTGTHPYSRRQ